MIPPCRSCLSGVVQLVEVSRFSIFTTYLQRHDGTDSAVADERKLMRSLGHEELDDLQPLGFQRWRLQKILFQASQDANIQVHFGKRLESLEELPDRSIKVHFADGTERRTRLLIGADGSKSQVRNLVCKGKHQLKYTGTTCLMGCADIGRPERGLCLPSSDTTKCHGAFFPTAEDEQCFQIHFPTDIHQLHQDSAQIDPKSFSWGGLTCVAEQEECNRLADTLKDDGWDDKYVQPLRHARKALKIGFSTLDPPLHSFVFGRTVLVSDACHPPTPYLGQGAQMGLEDAGTLALLLKEFCVKPASRVANSEESARRQSSLDFTHLDEALALYDQLRRPRAQEILGQSKRWGEQLQKQAANPAYNKMRHEVIKREIFYHETLPILLPVVRHDYAEEVYTAISALKAKKLATLLVHPVSRITPEHHLIPVPEEATCY